MKNINYVFKVIYVGEISIEGAEKSTPDGPCWANSITFALSLAAVTVDAGRDTDSVV